jgi:hypothetical protein
MTKAGFQGVYTLFWVVCERIKACVLNTHDWVSVFTSFSMAEKAYSHAFI